MQRSRRATLLFLSGLPGPEIVRAGTQGPWSIKDALAHFVAWEAEAVRRLRLITRGLDHRIHFYSDIREVDRFNADAVRKSRRVIYPALLRQAVRVRRRLIETLSEVPVRSLQDPSHKFPVVTWLPEFAWTHEQAHLREIKRRWRANQPPR